VIARSRFCLTGTQAFRRYLSVLKAISARFGNSLVMPAQQNDQLTTGVEGLYSGMAERSFSANRQTLKWVSKDQLTLGLHRKTECADGRNHRVAVSAE
jgi:hypothetical protein